MKKRILSCFMALALCLTLLPATALAEDAAQAHTHFLCGTNSCKSEDHTDEGKKTTFEKRLKSDDSGLRIVEGDSIDGNPAGTDDALTGWLLPAGAYYLQGEVTIDKPIVIRNKVTICLNGKTLQSTAENKPVFQIIGGELTLTNCEGTGKVIHSSSRGGRGTGVQVELGGKFNLYGGTITQNMAEYGGGVLVKSGTAFNMYGGSITDNTADGNQGYGGGGVCVQGGTFTMNGGTIAANRATIYTGRGNGGGVSVADGGTFEMNGGTIGGTSDGRDYNEATGSGGGVYVSGTKSTFTMNGSASVAYNKASSGKGDYTSKGGNGGGVYVSMDSEFEMNGKATSVSNNTATNSGGGVYVKSGTFTMNGNASVTDNKATYGNTLSGGGVYVEGGEFTMNGRSKVTGNAASGNKRIDGNGGGVYVKGGKFEMNGEATSVSNNTATTNGGGVYVLDNGTFTMNSRNASVTDNTADQGGGVYASVGTFTMRGGSITGNNRNGVFVSENATFTVSGAPTVMGNPREGAASNVFLTWGAKITIGTGGLNCDDGSIGVTKGEGRAGDAIATGATGVTLSDEIAKKFKIDDSTYVVKYENNQLVLAKRDGTTTPPTHKHEWTYTATGAIITATCKGEGCDVSGSVAITKPANLTYDGTKKLAMVEESENWKSVYSQDITITYEEMNGDAYKKIDGVPTEVGKYKASITVGGKTAFVEYEITDSTPEIVPVDSITLNKTSTSISVGNSEKLTAKVTPNNATDKSVTWTSSDNSVATVNNGTVTAVKAGTATITATAVGGTDKSATCTVTVTDGTTPSQPGGSTGGNTGGSSSGGGGGSSSDRDDYDSNPIIKTETKNNTDGSTTKTETRKDGSVTQTTTGKDGFVSKTETKKDGSSVTENKAADGSTGTVKTDKHGQTEAKTALSNKAVEDAKKNGEAVKAPVEVEASRNSNTAPTVKVELPKGAGETKVEIPVSNVKPGTVAVLVHPDGTEEIVKNSIPTEDGIQLTVDGNATVKIVDNSKNFIDTRNHWAEDAIDFVSARGLVNGMSDTIYAPNNSATRAQLWTILARQNDANLSGGNTWYEKAQLWSKDKGISDGTEPNAAINRAQMVTMLWRTMGQPAAGGAANFNDVPANSYYAQAVAWAVESGITQGVGGGRFDPAATCTRAQIAAFLTRLYAEK